jgi:hypothetical protein
MTGGGLFGEPLDSLFSVAGVILFFYAAWRLARS